MKTSRNITFVLLAMLLSGCGDTTLTSPATSSTTPTTTTSETIEPIHQHSFSEWTETEDKTGHERTCSECDIIETEEHSFDSGVVNQEPTHTQTGLKVYTCSVCHATKEETLPVLEGHTFSDWENYDDNKHKRTCECGKAEFEDHIWDDGITTFQPTATQDGEKLFSCTKCDATKTQVLAKKINDNLIFSLDFADANNRGANVVSDRLDADASIISNGNVSYVSNTIKGNTAAKFVSSGCRANYLKLPTELMDNDILTVSGWFKLDSNQVVPWGRLFFMSSNVVEAGDAPRLEMMPFQGPYGGIKWDLLEQMSAEYWHDTWLAPTNMNVDHDPNIPSNGGALMAKDVWVNLTWVLQNQGFKFYTNGKLAFSDNQCNLSPKNYKGDDGKSGIVFFSTFRDGSDDFSGSVADLRVYNKELNSSEIVSEYGIEMKDTKVFSLDFENGLNDSVRGLTGRKGDFASVVQNGDDNHCLELSSGATSTQSGVFFDYANKIFNGLHQFTISLDVLVDVNAAPYSRIFQGNINTGYGGAAMMLWVNGDGAVTLKLSTDWDTNAQVAVFELGYGEWHNLTVSLDGETAIAKVDNNTVYNNDFFYTNSILYTDTSVLSFGDQNVWGDTPFVGKLDNISIYNFSLQKSL